MNEEASIGAADTVPVNEHFALRRWHLSQMRRPAAGRHEAPASTQASHPVLKNHLLNRSVNSQTTSTHPLPLDSSRRLRGGDTVFKSSVARSRWPSRLRALSAVASARFFAMAPDARASAQPPPTLRL